MDNFEIIEQDYYNGCGCTMDHNLNEMMSKEAFSNAGGYGFWCGKKCAERKDAERAAELAKDEARLRNEEETLNIVKGYLADDGSTQRDVAGGSGTAQTILIIVAGVAIVAGVGYGIYKMTR